MLREDASVKYSRIKGWRKDYPVAALCRVPKVSESGHYAWVTRPPSPRNRENARLGQEIKASHQRTRGAYGPSRLQRGLADYGIFVGIGRIRRIRRKLGLRRKQKRKFKATANPKHALPLACWHGILLFQRLTGLGWVTPPASQRLKGGYTRQGLKTCLAASWLVTR